MVLNHRLHYSLSGALKVIQTSFLIFACLLTLVVVSAVASFAQNSSAVPSTQTAPAKQQPAANDARTTKDSTDKNNSTNKLAEKAKAKDKSNSLTADQIAEFTILVYGSRGGLTQIRRNGIERGRTIINKEDATTEEITFERRFIRGDKSEKDRIRLDQKLPTLAYSLLYKDGKISGIIDDNTFTPRQETADDFLAQMNHGLDTLLRYKENGASLNLVGKEKIKNVEMWVLDVTDAAKKTTRYYISAQKYRVLWLEYQDPTAGSSSSGSGSAPTKYRKVFHDYAVAQGTLVPFRTELFANDKLVSETQLATVTYGVKMDESIFQTTDEANARK